MTRAVSYAASGGASKRRVGAAGGSSVGGGVSEEVGSEVESHASTSTPSNVRRAARRMSAKQRWVQILLYYQGVVRFPQAAFFMTAS